MRLILNLHLITSVFEVPRLLSAKEPASQCRRCEFDSWVGKILSRRKWKPTPVLLPGKSHGQRSLAGYSPWGFTESDMTKQLVQAQASVYMLRSECACPNSHVEAWSPVWKHLKGGLWEWLSNEDGAFIKETQERSLTPAAMWSCIKSLVAMTQEVSPQQTLNISASWPEMSQPLKLWEINFCCL